MSAGSIFQCAICHTTCVQYGATRYDWFTGTLHDCAKRMDSWVEVIAADALDGIEESAHILPEAVNAWLLSR